MHAVIEHPLSSDLIMYVGEAENGELLEIGVLDPYEDPVVIHAMPARKKFTTRRRRHAK